MKLEGTKIDFLHGCCPLVVVFYEGLSLPTVDCPDRSESILAKWLLLTCTVWLLSHIPDFLTNESLQNSLGVWDSLGGAMQGEVSTGKITQVVSIICDRSILMWNLPWHIRRVPELQFRD